MKPTTSSDVPSRCAVPGWLGWLAEKIAETEKAVKAREQMGATWRTGSNAHWNAVADMHPSTAGRKSTKGERLACAARDDRIAEKLRRDLAMLKAIAAVLSHPNDRDVPTSQNGE